MAKLALAVLALALSPSLSQAGPVLESLRSMVLPNSGLPAAESLPPIPAPTAKPAAPPRPRPAEVVVYERGGYTWESDAERALNQAASNLRAAGIAVLGSRITRQEQSPWTYGFQIDYADHDAPPRRVETYVSNHYSLESDARDELNRTVANLRQAGYVVVLGQVLRQSDPPWNHFYQVDYLRGRRDPGGRIHVYNSGLYARAAEAQRDMIANINRLQSQGHEVLSATVYQDARTRYFFYQIRYR